MPVENIVQYKTVRWIFRHGLHCCLVQTFLELRYEEPPMYIPQYAHDDCKNFTIPQIPARAAP